MKKIALAFLFTTLVMPFISFAHPGHGGTDGYTIIHYFVEPAHAVVTFGILIVAFGYIMHSRKKANAK